VPAVERASRLLDALSASRQPLSLADLSRALSMPRSSVHGLLATLVTLGLARRNEDAEFSLGPKALQWADAYSAQSDVLRAFGARVDRSAELGTETVMLATLDGADVVYLACRQGSRPLAVNFRVGGRFPAACTSSGKAMLATLADPDVRASVERRLVDAGIAAERVELIGATASRAEHLALYSRVHVALDTVPYNGTTTTCEALWMGVPVIALSGDRHAARVSESLLRAAGHPEWIAGSESAYVDLAVGLARDRVQLAHARQSLRDELRASPLLDAEAYGARFRAALRHAWQSTVAHTDPERETQGQRPWAFE
jgi:DNA-binding IclR family transcriptional regulator